MIQKTLWLLLVSCVLSSQAIKVTDSGFTFSFEAVKTLKKLMETSGSDDADVTPAPVCTHPDLPEEFLEVCLREDRDTIFSNLVKIITPPDHCEICASAACSGCI